MHTHNKTMQNITNCSRATIESGLMEITCSDPL